MYSLSMSDEQEQLNKKYGFNDTVIVLKAKDIGSKSVILIKSVSMSYFTPKGKARLATKKEYCIYVGAGSDSRFKERFTNKSDATKAFRSWVEIIKNQYD